MKRRLTGDKELQLFTKRFYPVGTYNWPVPPGCTEVEVFIVGGGAGGVSASGRYKAGSGGGYTKTFRGKGYVKPSSGTWMGTYYDGRDGNAIAVTPGENIQIVVGKGGQSNQNGSMSYFKSTAYSAEGGLIGTYGTVNAIKRGGNGGSGGGANGCDGGKDGGDGAPYNGDPSIDNPYRGIGQGHTTRDFGEPTGTPNAAGSKGDAAPNADKGSYAEGSGAGNPNSGYGGAGNSVDGNYPGGDGTVLIRYWAYEE